MTKLEGRGMSCIHYPTGMNLGGDPTNAIIHSSPNGDFVIELSVTDIGQGAKTILAQIGAEALGVPVDRVRVNTGDTDTGPFDMGSFASRLTDRAGNAIIDAAEETRETMFDVASQELEAPPEDLVTDGEGNVHVEGAPDRSISIDDLAGAATFGTGDQIAGRGAALKPLGTMDPETGEMDPDLSIAYGSLVADVVVDSETGEVDVEKMSYAVDVGTVGNPKLVEGQVEGGVWMGMAHALYETTHPYYPEDHDKPTNWGEYPLPGPEELPALNYDFVEMPAESGPYGMKGAGEMQATAPIGALVNAVQDAIGTRIEKPRIPLTPEKILRAIEGDEAGDAAADASGAVAEGDD